MGEGRDDSGMEGDLDSFLRGMSDLWVLLPQSRVHVSGEQGEAQCCRVGLRVYRRVLEEALDEAATEDSLRQAIAGLEMSQPDRVRVGRLIWTAEWDVPLSWHADLRALDVREPRETEADELAQTVEEVCDAFSGSRMQLWRDHEWGQLRIYVARESATQMLGGEADESDLRGAVGELGWTHVEILTQPDWYVVSGRVPLDWVPRLHMAGMDVFGNVFGIAWEVEDGLKDGLSHAEIQDAFARSTTVWFVSTAPRVEERTDGSTHFDPLLVPMASSPGSSDQELMLPAFTSEEFGRQVVESGFFDDAPLYVLPIDGHVLLHAVTCRIVVNVERREDGGSDGYRLANLSGAVVMLPS